MKKAGMNGRPQIDCNRAKGGLMLAPKGGLKHQATLTRLERMEEQILI